MSTSGEDLPSGLHSGGSELRCEKSKLSGNISVSVEKKSDRQPFSSSVTTTAKLPVWWAESHRAPHLQRVLFACFLIQLKIQLSAHHFCEIRAAAGLFI